MKKFYKRISLALPLVLILSLILSFSASCSSAVLWESVGDKTISDGTKEYTVFDSPYAIIEDSPVYFVYENSPYNDYLSIYSYEKYGDIVWTDHGYIFATEAGMESLLSLEAGDAGSYRIYTENYTYSNVDAVTYDALISLSLNPLRIDVRDLYNYECFEIYGVDSTGSVIMPYGAVYVIDNAIYFLSFLDLPAGYFSSEGYFSYMKGEVDIYPTGDVLGAEIIALTDNATYNFPEYVYESEDYSEMDEDAAITVFYVIFTLVMLAFPAIFLIISLAIAAARKRRSNRYWLFGAFLSLLWIAASVAILIII